MHELHDIPAEATKAEKYEQLLTQLDALVADEPNLIANLANVSAALRHVFHFWWVGFYLVDRDQPEQLVLGPFQGPVACTRIRIGKGVCGTSWQRRATVVVPDVSKFAGHIACSSLSKSEIVVPLFDNVDNVNGVESASRVIGVLDVDSELLEHFDSVDQTYLEKVCRLISSKL